MDWGLIDLLERWDERDYSNHLVIWLLNCCFSRCSYVIISSYRNSEKLDTSYHFRLSHPSTLNRLTLHSHHLIVFYYTELIYVCSCIISSGPNASNIKAHQLKAVKAKNSGEKKFQQKKHKEVTVYTKTISCNCQKCNGSTRTVVKISQRTPRNKPKNYGTELYVVGIEIRVGKVLES